MTIDEQLQRLTGIVEALAGTVVAHDNQIDGLIQVAEKQGRDTARTLASLEVLERQWQAYINTLPRQ